MHLNLFLPSLESKAAPGALVRLARRALPAFLFSDVAKAEPGLLRRALKRLGPTWLSSPVRRAVQALSMALFLALLFYVCSPGDSAGYAEAREAREIIDAEAFLRLDPLLSTSTALAARAWVSSLLWAGAVILISLVIPRGFCGYVCPMGTLIDLFDRAVGGRVTRFRPKSRGRWVHLRYYILAGTLAAAALGVTLSGFVSAVPLVTRGMVYTLAPLLKTWHSVPPVNAGQFVSIAMFLAVLGLGLLRSRFWCRHVCPTGAVFSAVNIFRVTDRKVESTCIRCGRCAEVCPFDAIKSDYTTRGTDCTFCQTCGGVCPAKAINFVGRWKGSRPEPATKEISLSRRAFLGGGLGGVALALALAPGVRKLFGAKLGISPAFLPVRPPGSVPEREFLRMCVRCGECLNACPTDLLRPQGFERGLEGLWTPHAATDYSGCDPGCNNCGHVCPTGAIRALPLEEKRAARMGLAEVNEKTCLAHTGRGFCLMCADECEAAGYGAIEFARVAVRGLLKGEGEAVFLAPVVRASECVGCGLCQSRCYNTNVREKGLLKEAAIVVLAGPGKEDRMMSGSYKSLREEDRKEREEKQKRLEQ